MAGLMLIRTFSLNAFVALPGVALMSLLACHPDKPVEVPDASGDSTPTEGTDTSSAEGPRDTASTSSEDNPCDGVDNDEDGITDEGEADSDLDGQGDCTDTSCDITTSPALKGLETPACEPALKDPADLWDV